MLFGNKRNKVILHATTCKVKETSHKDHLLYECIDRKCSEQVNLQKQKVD